MIPCLILTVLFLIALLAVGAWVYRLRMQQIYGLTAQLENLKSEWPRIAKCPECRRMIQVLGLHRTILLRCEHCSKVISPVGLSWVDPVAELNKMHDAANMIMDSIGRKEVEFAQTVGEIRRQVKRSTDRLRGHGYKNKDTKLDRTKAFLALVNVGDGHGDKEPRKA